MLKRLPPELLSLDNQMEDFMRRRSRQDEGDETIMHFIGSQAHAYEKQKRDRTRWYWWLAIACLVAALILAWWGLIR